MAPGSLEHSPPSYGRRPGRGWRGGRPPHSTRHPWTSGVIAITADEQSDEEDAAPVLNPSHEAVDKVGSEEEEAGQELEQASHPDHHLHPLLDSGAQRQGHMGARAR